MEIIKKIYKETFSLSKLFSEYFKGLSCAFFDIETTGINANKNKVILIGIMVVDNQQMEVHQIFADTKKEEKKLLEHTLSLLEDIDILFNYNATAFDIPFLNKRFSINQVNYQIPRYKSFDLYKIIKKYGYSVLPNYKLKTVEQHMGIERTDELSGKECVENYSLFERNKDIELKKQILLHNLEDIYYLSKIFPLLNKYDIHKIMFETNRYINKDMVITKSKIKKHELVVQGFAHNLHQDCTVYGNAFTFIHESNSKQFTLNIQLYKRENVFFISLSDFDFPYSKKVPDAYIPDDLIIIKQDADVNHVEVNAFVNVLICNLVQQHQTSIVS